MERICTPRFFKETRVALVIDDFKTVNFQTCDDDTFYNYAELQGFVFTLKGFEKFIYSGELNALMNSVKHPDYIIPRFIDFYENYDGEVYCSDKEIEREELC